MEQQATEEDRQKMREILEEDILDKSTVDLNGEIVPIKQLDDGIYTLSCGKITVKRIACKNIPSNVLSMYQISERMGFEVEEQGPISDRVSKLGIKTTRIATLH